MANKGGEQLSGEKATIRQIEVLSNKLEKGVGPAHIHRGIQLPDGTFAHDDTVEVRPLGWAARRRREIALKNQREALARRDLNTGNNNTDL